MSINDALEDRLVEMVFADDRDSLPNWLSKIIRGVVFIENDTIYFRNEDINLTGGVSIESDYTTKAVMVAFVIAGIQWPFLFPKLLEKVNKQWKLKCSKQNIQQLRGFKWNLY